MLPELPVATPISSAEACRIARDLYGITVTAKRLPGEYDDNFQLEASGSGIFVLKVMHPAREDSFVDMQCRALNHLAERLAHIQLPRVIPNLRGESFSRRSCEGSVRLVWLLSFIAGATLAEAKPRSLDLLGSLGTLLGEIDAGLRDFSHPATQRDLKWDLSRSLWVRGHLSCIQNPERRALAEKLIALFETEVLPNSADLRRSVIYGDANDHNILIAPPWPLPRRVLSLIDFGDMHLGWTIAEPAVAAAYALLNQQDPIRAAVAVLSAYHKKFPLTEPEIAAFFPLLCARLVVSVINSAYRQSLAPHDPYVTISEAPAWEALERLSRINPQFAHYTFRASCDLPTVPKERQVREWLAENSHTAAPIIPVNLREGNCLVLDLSVGSHLLAGDPANFTESRMTSRLHYLMRESKADVAIGRYNEARPVYSSPLFGSSQNPTDERRSIHLGIDLFVAPNTAVSAPFDGTVHAFADNRGLLDYGPVVILRHATEEGIEFLTLYGHLSRDSLKALRVGQTIRRGERFAYIGTAEENGGWTPHLHFQIILDLLDFSTNFPGVAFPSQREMFTGLSPDPNMILGIPTKWFPPAEPSRDSTLAARKQILGHNLSISYNQPLKIVRGWRQYLYDETGRAYLDVYNNVPLVGHSHPRVVAAAQEQLAVLNTNTRYLHDNIVRYAERLTALLPSPLTICYFLNSGSEANELALRLARAHSGREDIIVLEHAYHGHTSRLIDISPYKFNGPGGRGQKPWVHVAPIPDDYRGQHRRGEPDLGKKYASSVGELLDEAKTRGREVATFIAETLPSVAGQIVFPAGYLEQAYKLVRAAGAVCIADEVQTGFSRVGTHFWGFEAQGVVPDILVLGKPIGNGFPLAAVITTPEIASSFDNGMEFFSTFGGNPVACAAGLAVLDILHEQNLQQNALAVGTRWMERLRVLQTKYPLIGDVRGSGLFLGIDLVNAQSTRAPATQQASYIVNRLRERGILTGTDGPHQNVIKLRPPLIFSDDDAELFTATLAEILLEDSAQPA